MAEERKPGNDKTGDLGKQGTPAEVNRPEGRQAQRPGQAGRAVPGGPGARLPESLESRDQPGFGVDTLRPEAPPDREDGR